MFHYLISLKDIAFNSNVHLHSYKKSNNKTLSGIKLSTYSEKTIKISQNKVRLIKTSERIFQQWKSIQSSIVANGQFFHENCSAI